MTDTLDDMDALLASSKRSKAKRQQATDLVPSTMLFTEGAYAKADALGPLVKEMFRSDYEWSGFLLARKDDPEYIVRDILLQKGQDISRGGVEISGEDVARAAETLKSRNKAASDPLYVIGWIHGHGTCGLIPSTTDENNFVKVINSVSLNTERSIQVPLTLIETDEQRTLTDQGLIISGTAQEDGQAIYRLREDVSPQEFLAAVGRLNSRKKPGSVITSFLDLLDVQLTEPQIVGFAYFAILNNRHDTPYASVGMSAEHGITKTKKTKIITGIDLETITTEDDIAPSKEDLQKEVKENIPEPRRYFFLGPHTGKGKRKTAGFGTGRSVYHPTYGWLSAQSPGDDEPYGDGFAPQTAPGQTHPEAGLPTAWSPGQSVPFTSLPAAPYRPTPAPTTQEYPYYFGYALVETLEAGLRATEQALPAQTAEPLRGMVQLLSDIRTAPTRQSQDDLIIGYFTQLMHPTAQQTSAAAAQTDPDRGLLDDILSEDAKERLSK